MKMTKGLSGLDGLDYNHYTATYRAWTLRRHMISNSNADKDHEAVICEEGMRDISKTCCYTVQIQFR